MNVFTFSGNLGGDCRTNTVSGTDVCNFSVACTSGFGDKKQTHWIDCAYWGNGGKAVAPYLKKGQTVVVSGEVSLTPATDKYAAKISVRVNTLTLAGGKRDDVASPQRSEPAPTAAAADDLGDCPF
jgi:single-strand DNA-binding protein